MKNIRLPITLIALCLVSISSISNACCKPLSACWKAIQCCKQSRPVYSAPAAAPLGIPLAVIAAAPMPAPAAPPLPIPLALMPAPVAPPLLPRIYDLEHTTTTIHGPHINDATGNPEIMVTLADNTKNDDQIAYAAGEITAPGEGSISEVETDTDSRYQGGGYGQYVCTLLLEQLHTRGCQTIRVKAHPYETTLGTPERTLALENLIRMYTAIGRQAGAEIITTVNTREGNADMTIRFPAVAHAAPAEEKKT